MAYLDLTSAKFEAAMVAGQIPLPVTVGGQERWIRAQIDERLAELAGGKEDWFAKTPAAHGRME